MSRYQVTARRIRCEAPEGEIEQIARAKATLPPPDPFFIRGSCTSAGGHEPFMSAGSLVCFRCERVLWSEQ